MVVFNMNKKGQGIALETIVKGIIAVVVLVVIIFAITKSARQNINNLDSCESKGAVSVGTARVCTDGGGIVVSKVAGTEKVCCITPK